MGLCFVVVVVLRAGDSPHDQDLPFTHCWPRMWILVDGPLIIQQGCKLIDRRSSATQVAICLSPRIHFEVSEHLFVSDDGIFMRFLLNSTLHRIRT